MRITINNQEDREKVSDYINLLEEVLEKNKELSFRVNSPGTNELVHDVQLTVNAMHELLNEELAKYDKSLQRNLPLNEKEMDRLMSLRALQSNHNRWFAQGEFDELQELNNRRIKNKQSL